MVIEKICHRGDSVGGPGQAHSCKTFYRLAPLSLPCPFDVIIVVRRKLQRLFSVGCRALYATRHGNAST